MTNKGNKLLLRKEYRMTRVSRFLALTAVAAISPLMLLNPVNAEANQWEIDTAHSSANFAVKHMMVSNVRGRFPKVNGSAQYDGKQINSIKVNAVIETNSVNTDNDKRDQHLRGKDFFNVEKYPKMKFVSKKIVKGKKGSFKLVGDLTIHGITKEVSFDVDGPSAVVKGPHGKTRVGAFASTTINRKDFGLTYGGVLDNGGAVVSDDVKISLDIELVKANTEKKSQTPDKKLKKAS